MLSQGQLERGDPNPDDVQSSVYFENIFCPFGCSAVPLESWLTSGMASRDKHEAVLAGADALGFMWLLDAAQVPLALGKFLAAKPRWWMLLLVGHGWDMGMGSWLGPLLEL